LPVPFIWVMRGTPILLQLLFWYNVLPTIGIHTSAMATAIIGMALNEIAFMAEIIRGGLLSVKQTQRDAAAALGLKRWQVLHRVVIPQALRTIAPAMSNEAIIIIKNTSLASVITVGELTLRSEQVVSTNFEYVPVFAAAAVLYLIATTGVVIVQSWLEARLNIERKARLSAEATLRRREAGIFGVGDTPASIVPAAMLAGSAPSPEPDDTRIPWDRLMRRLRRAPRVEIPTPHPARGETSPELLSALRASQEASARGGEPYVQIRDVRKAFHGTEVIKGVSLDVEPGNVVFLIGP